MQRNYQLKLKGAVSVSESVRERLFAAGTRKKLKAGQVIWQQGDKANGFFGILSGVVQSSKMGLDGNRTIFGRLSAGDLIGEGAYFAKLRRVATLEALTPAEIVWFSDAAFRKSLAHDNEILMLLLRSVSGQFQEALQLVDNARRLSASDRLAAALIAVRCGEDGVVAATHQELAELVGVSRVSLGTALAQLAKVGAVQRNYGSIRIIDRAALRSRVARQMRVSA
jgi:CRP/FNR family transcriptional regulator, cyclic AMP receptor protein